jgi:hypothetical protein
MMKDDIGHYDPAYMEVFKQVIQGKKK